MYLLALRIGLSCEELRRVQYSTLLWLIHRYGEMSNTSESKSQDEEVREATDADLQLLMMM